MKGLLYVARPTKWRKVEYIPDVNYFTPFNTSTKNIEQNIMRIEELEALRLKDLNGLEQEACANKMEVSRQTFQRVLSSARKKVADSLVNGKAIRIEGGNFTRNICSIYCMDCGREWLESYEKLMVEDYNCPDCGSVNIACVKGKMKRFCRGKCWRQGHANSNPGKRPGK